MKNLLYILLVLLLISSSCRKPDNCPEEFVLPSAQLFPYDSVYQIGDTISLFSKFSKYVYEKNTETTYNMENIIWTASMSIIRIDSGKTGEDANRTKVEDYFSVINCSDSDSLWYTYSTGATALELTYRLDNDSFRISFSMIPKRKGVLIIAFGGGIYESNQEFEGKCKNTAFSGGTPFNEGKDNNIYLLKESPIPHYNNWILQKPEERFYKHRYFALRIIE